MAFDEQLAFDPPCKRDEYSVHNPFGRTNHLAQYCDTKKLEKTWFNWLIAKSTPALEQYRTTGQLWTRTIGLVMVDGVVLEKAGKTFADPMYPIRAHCILSDHPHYFTTFAGKPQDIASLIHANDHEITVTPVETKTIASIKNVNIEFKYKEALEKDGYIKERCTQECWDGMLIDIQKMCFGIAHHFHQKTEEDLNDLAHEALIQVLNKLKSDRLIFTPGRAPVFNLLTTTIHNILFSIMNKRKNQKEGLYKLLQDAQSGSLPQSRRSLRFQTHNITKKRRSDE